MAHAAVWGSACGKIRPARRAGGGTEQRRSLIGRLKARAGGGRYDSVKGLAINFPSGRPPHLRCGVSESELG